MGWLLVTNDDGVDSPALPPFLRALQRVAPVRGVVPAGERSWISKAITRFDPVRVRRVERGGIPLFAVEGFPADCTNLGVHSLFDERPEMVVSGINLGLNHGLAFLLSSGTVGAAMEGWIAGLPAIAFSVGDPARHGRLRLRMEQEGAEVLFGRAATLAAGLVREVRAHGFPPGVDLLNVNFPLDAGPQTPRRVTRLAVVGYDDLFRLAEDGLFVHDFSGGFRDVQGDLAGTDLETLGQGFVSITPVRLAHTAEIPESLRRALERSGGDRRPETRITAPRR